MSTKKLCDGPWSLTQVCYDLILSSCLFCSCSCPVCLSLSLLCPLQRHLCCSLSCLFMNVKSLSLCLRLTLTLFVPRSLCPLLFLPHSLCSSLSCLLFSQLCLCLLPPFPIFSQSESQHVFPMFSCGWSGFTVIIVTVSCLMCIMFSFASPVLLCLVCSSCVPMCLHFS